MNPEANIPVTPPTEPIQPTNPVPTPPDAAPVETPPTTTFAPATPSPAPVTAPTPMPEMAMPPQQPVAAAPLLPAKDPGTTLAVVGLVFAFIFAPVGIVLSILAKNKSKKAGFKNTLATVGIVLSILFLLPYLILFVVIPMMVANKPADSQTDSTGNSSVQSNVAAKSGSSDDQRKTDIRAIQKGLEEYYVDNKAYPASLTVLTTGKTAYLVSLPKDPSSSGAHVYAYTPSANKQSYKLTACLDATTNTGSGTYQPIAPCTTSSFVVVNLDGE